MMEAFTQPLRLDGVIIASLVIFLILLCVVMMVLDSKKFNQYGVYRMALKYDAKQDVILVCWIACQPGPPTNWRDTLTI